jgi:high affinity sulfate transporter 1
MTHKMKTTRASTIARFAPMLAWLPQYDRTWLRPDLIAGLTLWGLVVPEAMAYAGIAGLPPQAGLYTLLASLSIYALFGSSRHLTVQATSATAALLAATILAFGVSASDPARYQAYASALVIVVGLVFLVAGLARLGFVTQFLSKPVMDGFVTGLAIFVAVGQLNKLFGVESGEGNTLIKLLEIIRQLPAANWIAFAVGASALALLFLLPRLNRQLPAGLIVLFGFIVLSWALDLPGHFGVAVVGALPAGLPALAWPQIPLMAWVQLVLPAMGILLVAYSEALGVAREFAEKHGYEIDPDQELYAHAFVNLASGFLGGMLAGGSMSASAVKEGAGARSQVANLVTWVAAIVTVLFLTPLFAPLPEAVLAALIIHAVWHIIVARKLRQIRLVSRTEFWLGALALAGVLLIDVLQGMIIGLVVSLLLVIYRSSRPNLSSLGRAPGMPGVYTDLARHPDNEALPGLLILRLNAPIYYANALTVRDRIKALVAETNPNAVVLDAEGQDALDITSADVLKLLIHELTGQGITVYLAEVHEPVREMAQRTGLLALLPPNRIYPSVELAVRHLEESGAVAKTPLA